MAMKTMLVPIDFSDITPTVVRTAGDWAVASGHRVHLFHVLPEDTDLVGYESGLQILPYVPPPESSEEKRLMQTFRDELVARGLEVTTRIVQGSAVLDIIDEAVAVDADVIVLGSHRHGVLHHLFLGSVSAGVLRRAPCPVMVVPAPLSAKATEQQQKTDTLPAGA